MTIMAVDPVLARRAEIQQIAQATGHRRELLSRLALLACRACLVVILIPLAALLVYVVIRGASAWSWAFFSHLPTPAGIPGGGIWNAIVGSFIIDAMAAAAAIPFGIAAGLFLAESMDGSPEWCAWPPTCSPGCPRSSWPSSPTRCSSPTGFTTSPPWRQASPSGSSCCR